MKLTSIASALLLALPLVALADDPPAPKEGFAGSGEAGLAVASGNTKSENINVKVDLKFNDDRWKDDFYVLAVRNKADVTNTTTGATDYQTTANRWEGGASMGYKMDDRSYIVGALRYEHDQFSPYNYQYIASLGYGLQVLKNPMDELSFEIGPGYKVVQPSSIYIANPTPPPDFIKIKPDSDNNLAGRGKVDYKHNFNSNTSLIDSFLVESASGNTFMQNDLGLSVKMTNSLALKATYEVRHNSEVADGFKNTDQLLTTNLVYSF
jgi:putative salt-induced outer membrane protein